MLEVTEANFNINKNSLVVIKIESDIIYKDLRIS